MESKGSDRLMFNHSANGKISVKRAYKQLNKSWRYVTGNQPSIWKKIWKFGSMQPRLRLFMWKLVNGALPLAKIIFHRTGYGVPSCALCLQDDEDGIHMVFKCPFARTCWLASDIPLRTEQLPNTVREVLTQVLQWMSEEKWSMFASILWAIWRCRNAKVYQGQHQTISHFFKYVSLIKRETMLVNSLTGTVPGGGTIIREATKRWVCFTDASWVNSWDTSTGFFLQE